MKKLTLLLIATLVLCLSSYAQMESKGCGWVFRSTKNVLYTKSDDYKRRATGNIEIYYDETCEKYLRICYVNGKNEYYYPASEKPIKRGATGGGEEYNLYKLRDARTKEVVYLQIIKGEFDTTIRLHYSDGYAEFYY